MEMNGIQVFGELATRPGLYLSPLRLFGLLPVYCLWALPTVGWLLMVSSWARGKVFLWAVGVPLLLAVLLVWGGELAQLQAQANWIQSKVIARTLLGTLPGSWYLFEPALLPQLHAGGAHMAQIDVFGNSWSSLGLPAAWLAAAAGAAMIWPRSVCAAGARKVDAGLTEPLNLAISGLPNAPPAGAVFMEKLFLFSQKNNNYFIDSYLFQTISSIRLLNQYPELNIKLINNYFYRTATAIKLSNNRTEKPQLHFR